MKKSKKIIQTPSRPNRDPDHYSKRGVPYWFSPEFVRGTSADIFFSTDFTPSSPGYIALLDGRFVWPCSNYGKIHAVKKNKSVELHMLSREGNLSYIQGSIQDEFIRWHEDRQIDYMLLGQDPDDIIKDASIV